MKTGGGEKHRMTLNEMIMIKDYHLAIEKSIQNIVRKAKKTKDKVEVEVETQKDAILCAKLGVDIIMLDNFSPIQIKNTIKTESTSSDNGKKKIFNFIDDLLQKTKKIGDYDQKI